MSAQFFGTVLCMDAWIFLMTNFSSHFAHDSMQMRGSGDSVFLKTLRKLGQFVRHQYMECSDFDAAGSVFFFLFFFS